MLRPAAFARVGRLHPTAAWPADHGEMVSIGTLFAFALVCGAVVYLRKSDAEIFRPFRTPAVPWVPSLGIAFSILLMVFLPWETWLRLIVWLVIGLVIYFVYGRSHSVLMNGEKR